MRATRHDDDFTAFVYGSRASLRRTAYLLTGDWHAAEDIVQTALAKVYVAWPRVDPATALAYARTVVTRVFLDGRRRRSAGERPAADVGDMPATADACLEDRLLLLTALAALPAGQRAAVVLRHWDGESVEHVADVLRISPGTVRSQCAKGLSALRRQLGVHYTGERL